MSSVERRLRGVRDLDGLVAPMAGVPCWRIRVTRAMAGLISPGPAVMLPGRVRLPVGQCARRAAAAGSAGVGGGRRREVREVGMHLAEDDVGPGGEARVRRGQVNPQARERVTGGGRAGTGDGVVNDRVPQP